MDAKTSQKFLEFLQAWGHHPQLPPPPSHPPLWFSHHPPLPSSPRIHQCSCRVSTERRQVVRPSPRPAPALRLGCLRAQYLLTLAPCAHPDKLTNIHRFKGSAPRKPFNVKLSKPRLPSEFSKFSKLNMLNKLQRLKLGGSTRATFKVIKLTMTSTRTAGSSRRSSRANSAVRVQGLLCSLSPSRRYRSSPFLAKDQRHLNLLAKDQRHLQFQVLPVPPPRLQRRRLLSPSPRQWRPQCQTLSPRWQLLLLSSLGQWEVHPTLV